MNPPSGAVGHDAVVTEELVNIVMHASQLGYSPWRVGIALRVPPTELAWICARVKDTGASSAKTVSAMLHGPSFQAASNDREGIEQEPATG